MERLLDSGLRCCKNDYCMCRLQGVKMHIATSLQLPPAAGGPDDLAGAGDWIGAWTPVTSQIWFVHFFKTQFDLPRAM